MVWFFIITGVVLVLAVSLTGYIFNTAEKNRRRFNSGGIVQTWVIDERGGPVQATKTGSAVGRGVVGGALFGPVGAIVGASTAKQKTVDRPIKVTFLIKWDDGSEEKFGCIKGSDFYCTLIQYVK